MISLAGLNPEQRAAAETIEGPLLILAGAGSGKTRTITYRMAHMVANCGIDPGSILGVSFTNKAAKEMRERMTGLLPKSKTRKLGLCTFHSFGVRVLKKEIHHLGLHPRFTIYDSGDQLSIIREALKNFKAEKGAFDRKTILSKISSLKNRNISADEYADSAYFDDESPYDHATEYCYHYYQEKMSFYNAIDFDDILFLTVKLFRLFPDIATKYSEKYRYVVIDEYQDTNPLQFEIVMGLTKTHQNLCVVGDDDQAIYGFRGADVKNILAFEKNYPEAKLVKLEENYRSIMPILELSNKVIEQNKARRDKRLWSSRHNGQKPLLWAMGDTDHEAEVIADEIAKLQSEGIHLGEVAILYRSNTQLGPLEDQVRMHQIPYTVIGGQKLYEKKEIKDLIAYLCLLKNPQDELALRRVLNVPSRGIGTKSMDYVLEKAKARGLSAFDAIIQDPLDGLGARGVALKSFVTMIQEFQEVFEHKSIEEGVSLLVERIKFFEFIDKSYDDQPKQAERRRKDVHHFVESARRFKEYYKDQATLDSFVEKLLLQDSQDKKEGSEEDDDIRPNEVTLMTLHSSKGLEFDNVFLVGIEEELLPHKRTILEGEDLSEELRLLYVGITRARKKLVMTYAKTRKLYGQEKPRFISRFLVQLGADQTLYNEQDRTAFGHLTEEEAQEYKKDFFANLMEHLGP